MNQQTIDKLEILELMNNYILSIDSHDIEQFTANFSEDGVYKSPFGTATGADEIRYAIRQWHESGVTAGKRHFIGAVRILDLTNETAKAESNYWIAEAAETPGIVASGAYTDELKKINGEWKIAFRDQLIDPSWAPAG